MQNSKKGINTVGIVPISGRTNTLESVIPDCLLPLGPGINCLQRSILECAYAGCSSIWVICNDDTLPIIKNTIGDYIMDPIIYESWNYKKIPELSKQYIPIFYSPVLQKDRNRRDTIGWSILHGALTAFIVSSKISKWSIPKNYFVSFPYGIVNPKNIRQARANIRAGKKVYGTYHKKTVQHGAYLPFTFTPDDWLQFRRKLNEENTGGAKSIPIQERWSAKNFTLDKIFYHDNIVVDEYLEFEKYYDIDSWESYGKYFSSDLTIKKIPTGMSKPFFIRKEEVE